MTNLPTVTVTDHEGQTHAFPGAGGFGEQDGTLVVFDDRACERARAIFAASKWSFAVIGPSNG